jgi:hypothetical protein
VYAPIRAIRNRPAGGLSSSRSAEMLSERLKPVLNRVSSSAKYYPTHHWASAEPGSSTARAMELERETRFELAAFS